MHSYTSILAAAEGLLGEACLLAGATEQQFIVVGGWSPYYLNSHSIRHPGSRDVDLLFRDGEQAGRIEDVISHFLERDYKPSAKHEFQLLRILDVAGTEFVFNLDLLHPSEGIASPEMFVDHLTLPIPKSEYRDDSFSLKSIMIPESRFLFDGYFENHEITCRLPVGDIKPVRIPVMTEVGTIVTKSKTVGATKRRRDAFDVFLAISQARDYEAVVRAFRDLKVWDRPVFNTLYGIREALDSQAFADNLMSVMAQTNPPSMDDRNKVEAATAIVAKFLGDVTLDAKAENLPSRRHERPSASSCMTE